ncbi:MAG: phage major capsid protein [Anaerovoracaceae bacterium]
MEAEDESKATSIEEQEPVAEAAPVVEPEPVPESEPVSEPARVTKSTGMTAKVSGDEGDVLIAFGGAVKALGDGKIGGYLVRFSGPDAPDLEGEFFAPDTDYGAHRATPVYYQHGQDKKLKRRVLDEDAELRTDEVGVWIEAQLAMRDKYEQWIYSQAEKGRMGWSSGTAPHLVEREPEGGATRIKRWPLGLDASLTPTPAEPRNAAIPLKSWTPEVTEWSLAESEPAVKALMPEEGAEPSAGATEPLKATTIRVSDREEPEMAETEEKTTPEVDVAAVATEAAEKAVAAMWEQMKAHPAVERQIELTPEGKDRPETKSFGDFCVAVMRGDTKRLSQVYKSTKAELAETSGETGGYLVPTEHSREIMRVATENAFVRPRARIIPMTSRDFDMPALDYSGTDAGEPHSLGGVVMNWTEEGGGKTETEPTFDNIALKYHELSGYTVASNMLRQDAPGLEALLTQLFGTAIGWFEDWAFLNGSGSGQPLGVFNAGCLLAEVAASSTFVLSDAAAMLEMFMSSTPSAGVWVMHPKVLHLLIAMADGSGAANNLIWQPNARESVPATLFGKPIIFSEKMPVLPPGTSAATKGGVLLADFSYYLIGDRKQIAIDFSEHYKFIENKGTWRVCEYVDGQPWMKSYRTLADGSTQVSPFVTLKGA